MQTFTDTMAKYCHIMRRESQTTCKLGLDNRTKAFHEKKKRKVVTIETKTLALINYERSYCLPKLVGLKLKMIRKLTKDEFLYEMERMSH